jgi:hypothetical protein
MEYVCEGHMQVHKIGVLVRGQPVSSAKQGVIGKFQRPYEGPFHIKEVVTPTYTNY